MKPPGDVWARGIATSTVRHEEPGHDFLDNYGELLKTDPPTERVEPHKPGERIGCICQECAWLRAKKRDER